MQSYLSIAWNIGFNHRSLELEKKKPFFQGKVSVKTKCMVIYLFSACDIYSYNRKDIVDRLECYETSIRTQHIPYLPGSDFEVQ